MSSLGHVPVGWQQKPLWSMFAREKDTGHPDETMLSVFREHGVVEKDSRENLNVTAEDRNIYQLVDKGWLVVNRMKAWQGSVGVSSYRGIVSGHYLCFRPTHGESPRYLNWLLRSDFYIAEYRKLSRGVRPGQAEIDNDLLRVLPITLPPRDEQERIADFLDDQVTLLDHIVALRDTQIALLDERHRTRVQGLVRGSEGQPLRAVGGWLGALRSSWSLSTIGRRSRIWAGCGFPPELQGQDQGDVPFLKVSDFARADAHGFVSGAANRVSRVVAGNLGAAIAPEGTVLLPKVGAALLTNARVVLGAPAAFDNNVMGIEFRDGSPSYWRYLLGGLDLGRLANPGARAIGECRTDKVHRDPGSTAGGARSYC
jgi:type I restriction enzyme S subunit